MNERGGVCWRNEKYTWAYGAQFERRRQKTTAGLKAEVR